MDSYLVAAIVVAGIFLLITFTIALVALIKCQTHSHEDGTAIRTLEPYGVISSHTNMLVYRPGFQGNQVGLYTNFETLMNVMDQMAGPRLIFFDPSDAQGEALRITPRSNGAVYSMKLVKWATATDFQTIDWKKRNQGVELLIQDGVQISDLSHIDGPLRVVYEGLLPLMKLQATTTFANQLGPHLYLDNGASLECRGTAPFAEVTSGGEDHPLQFVCHMGRNTTLKTGTCPVLRATLVGAGLLIGPPREDWYVDMFQIRVACEGVNWALQENCLGTDADSSIMVDLHTLSGNPRYHARTYNLPAMDREHWPAVTNARFHVGLYFNNCSGTHRTFVAAKNLEGYASGGIDPPVRQGEGLNPLSPPGVGFEVSPYDKTDPLWDGYVYPDNVWRAPFFGPPQKIHDRSKGFLKGDQWIWWDQVTGTGVPPQPVLPTAEMYVLIKDNPEAMGYHSNTQSLNETVQWVRVQ